MQFSVGGIVLSSTTRTMRYELSYSFWINAGRYVPGCDLIQSVTHLFN